MYLNTYQLDHLFFSDTRAFMALIMGAAMAVIMLSIDEMKALIRDLDRPR